MPRARILILAATLAGCGAPGADTVFVRALPGGIKAAAPTADSVPTPPRAEREIRAYRGLYYRDGDISTFQPCGRRAALDVTGTAEGRALLRERFLWNATWQGRPMFGVFQGAIVLDTLGKRVARDSTPPDTVTRFFITGVDTLRAWEHDCPGMKVP